MLSVVTLAVFGWMTSFGQALESEVPGDNFSLEGALELFKKSASPEEFEKMLNSPDSKVNNLDLNGDGYIDYIRVIDRYEGNVHAFILQAVISDRENQDIAVIELEKLANGKAILQIVGDPDIYGVETIIEPTSEVRTYAGTTTTRTVVNVWAWPSVQYVYAPYYTVWVSPWGWYSRPVWWSRWRPIAYVHYYPIWRPYRHYYSYCDSYRVVYAHRHLYHPHRTTSVIVHDRHHARVAKYRSENRDQARRTSRSSSRSDDQRFENSDRDRRSTRGSETTSAGSRSRTPDLSRDMNGRTSDLNRNDSRERATSEINRRERRPSGDSQLNNARTRQSTPSLERRSTTPERRSTNEVRTPNSGLNRSEAPRQQRQTQEVRQPSPTRSNGSSLQQRSAPRERSAPSTSENRSSPRQQAVSRPSSGGNSSLGNTRSQEKPAGGSGSRSRRGGN